MKSLLIKVSLFILLSVYVLLQQFDAKHIFDLLVILVSFLLIHLLKQQVYKYLVVFIYTVICLFYPDLTYGLMLLPFGGMSFYTLIPLLTIILIKMNLEVSVILGTITVLVSILIYYIEQFNQLSSTKQQLEDSLVAQTHHAETEKENLLNLKQHDLEVSVLNERNRIARDIHDNVGHLLTSAILQVGAIQAETNNSSLDTLKDTLDKGMNAIRKSVHALYNESFLLKQEIKNILDEYPQLQIDYQYKISNEPNKVIKVTLINLVKESLNNVTKHSNATDVIVQFDESPHHYYCLIHDNGTIVSTLGNSSGIGLLSLEKRVKDVSGIINIQNDNGFRIYVSIPKEK